MFVRGEQVTPYYDQYALVLSAAVFLGIGWVLLDRGWNDVAFGNRNAGRTFALGVAVTAIGWCHIGFLIQWFADAPQRGCC